MDSFYVVENFNSIMDFLTVSGQEEKNETEWDFQKNSTRNIGFLLTWASSSVVCHVKKLAGYWLGNVSKKYI